MRGSIALTQPCLHLQCPPQLLAPLVNMSKTGYEKICLCCLASWSFTQNIHKNLFIEVKLLKPSLQMLTSESEGSGEILHVGMVSEPVPCVHQPHHAL